MMIDRNVRVSIELKDARGNQRCQGPMSDGLCPASANDGVVPCAGGRILPLRGTSADGAWLVVADDAGPRCPLSWLVSVVPAPWD
jgi:hypothetical protein